MSTFNSGFGTAFDRPIYPSRVTPSPQSLYGSSNRRSIPSVGAFANSPGLASPVSPTMPSTNQTPLVPSVKVGLQSAAIQSPGAYTDRMNMGQAKIAAAQNMNPAAATPANPIQVTEQQARSMFANAPGNTYEDKINAFHDLGKQWNFDSHQLLAKWASNGTFGQTQFPTGETQTTPGQPGTAVSMLGSANSAGNSIAARVPMMSANESGMTVGGTPSTTTPIMGPEQGYTPLPSMGTTGMSDPNRYALSKAAAVHQAQNDQDHAMIAGQTELDSLPPSPREQFDAGTQIAQTAAEAPAAVAQEKSDTAQQVAQTRATGLQNAAATTAAGRVAAANARGGAGGKAPASPQDQRVSVATTQLRSALEALRTNKTPEAQQAVINRAMALDAAQKDREAGTAPPGATTKPTAQPPAINGDGSPDPYAKAAQQKPTRAQAAQYVQKFGQANAAQRLKADGYDTSGYAD